MANHVAWMRRAANLRIQFRSLSFRKEAGSFVMRHLCDGGATASTTSDAVSYTHLTLPTKA